MTDLSLEALAKGCPNLKQMCLKKCCFVSNNGLVDFAKAAKSLESLQLEECNRITQIGILNAISSSSSKLKSVSLVKCMGLKDLSTEFPIVCPCEYLRCLSIRSCPGFGSTSLAMVGKLCPNLHHLDLIGLCGIIDNGLLPLLECCEAGLAKVHLSDCLNLTDEVILALARLHGERILAFPASFGQMLTRDLIDTNLLCSGTKIKKKQKRRAYPCFAILAEQKWSETDQKDYIETQNMT